MMEFSGTPWGATWGKKHLWCVLVTILLAWTSFSGGAYASVEEDCLTAKINEERQAQGAARLSPHSDLVSIARRHSGRMSRDQRYYHNANLRSELPAGWRSEGENVGWATDCAHMHNFFLNSPSHRKNILNSAFNRVGIGVVIDSAGKLWVTEVFMESSSPGLSIDSEAALSAPTSQLPDAAPAEKPPPAQDEALSSAPKPGAKDALARTASPRPAEKQAPAEFPEQNSVRRTEDPAQTPDSLDVLETEVILDDPFSDENAIVFDLDRDE